MGMAKLKHGNEVRHSKILRTNRRRGYLDTPYKVKRIWRKIDDDSFTFYIITHVVIIK